MQTRIIRILFVLLALLTRSAGSPVANFANSSTPDTRLQTNSPTGQMGFTTGVNTYRIGLYAAQGVGQPESALALIATAINATSPFDGLFNGGSPLIFPAPFHAGDVTFQIRAWTLSAGPTYEIAASVPGAYLGKSSRGTVTLSADFLGHPPRLFGTNSGQVAGFTLAPMRSTTAPVIGGIVLTGTNLVIRGTNGSAGGTYYVLNSTNVALPLTNWTRLATNMFDANGNFSCTNGIISNLPRQFYLLQLP